MANQQQIGTGTVYDGDQVVSEVSYELNGTGQGATGILTFQDILVRQQVLILLEDNALTLATQAGQRLSFMSGSGADGSSPGLPIELVDSNDKTG